MKTLFSSKLTLLLTCFIVQAACYSYTINANPKQTKEYPFMNISLSWDERVDDLVGRLTVDEITLQMANGGRTTYAPGIDRLGIKPYPWGSECLRGDVGAGPATSFPQALGLAASFSPGVIFDMARATGLEVRAKFNNYSSHEYYGVHSSASCWSPVINIMRDPRWGRNQETYGEDPYMSGLLSQHYVRGLQGDDERYIMANAGCKHFDVYAGPENIPESRMKFNAKVSTRDWRMTFLPAFKMCVEAGTYSLMCSYNSVNGIPACANKELLTDILRGEWGFRGYVISDEEAIEVIMTKHKYTTSIVDTAAAAVNAGCNLEDGPSGKNKPYFLAISDAVKQGKLKESTVREAVKPLFYTRMRLGLFDPPKMNPYTKLNVTEFVQSKAHRDLAIKSAAKSFVLLKNEGSLLPLPKNTKFDTISIVGPMADNVDGIFGEYAPTPNLNFVKTPRQGLSPLANSVKFAAGCKNSDTACTDYDSVSIKDAVTGSNFVVVCLGTGRTIESEGNDRKDITLPGKQLQLLQDAVKNAGDAPVVLLLFNAGPLDISWAKYSSQVPVIMECFFPAQGTGEALKNVFLNESPEYNPAGRLPATWPVSLKKFPDMTNYSMAGRTYRYWDNPDNVMYPFGYGLSYSSFSYRTLAITPGILEYTDDLSIYVYVNNKGQNDGEEVVQVYISWDQPSLPVPRLQLIAFDRIMIPAGTGRSIVFKVSREQLAVWDDDDKGFKTLSGSMTVFAGGQQPGQQMDVGSNVLKGKITVV